MLIYALGIFKECSKIRKRNKNEENSAVNNWSVYSEVYSSESESDEELTIRLRELDKGDRLKRRSTMVSDFGFKKENKIDEQPVRLESDYKTTTTGEIIKLNDCKKPKSTFMKCVSNKRVSCPQRIRAEALYFMNQLGKKLRNSL